MSIRIFAAALAAATLAAACTPAPGSAEWCKGVIEGKITASEADINAHDAACSAVIMQEMTKGLQ